jgi:hypothetical protein
MTAFKIGASDKDNFFYQIGNVKTNVYWHQPTQEAVNALVNDIKKLRLYTKYELFLVGGVVNGGIGRTWDIDIVINGKLDTVELESFMTDIYELALNVHRLLVDVRWLDKKPNIKGQYRLVRFGKVTKKVGHNVSHQNLFKTENPLSDLLIEHYYWFDADIKTNYVKI